MDDNKDIILTEGLGHLLNYACELDMIESILKLK